jgi:hypothetical protein
MFSNQMRLKLSEIHIHQHKIAVLESILLRSTTSIFIVLKSIAKKHKIKSFESDIDATLYQYEKEKNIDNDVVAEQRINNFCIIEIFMIGRGKIYQSLTPRSLGSLTHTPEQYIK